MLRVQPLPIIGGDRSVAARPAFLAKDDGCKRALVAVDAAKALAHPLASREGSTQLLHALQAVGMTLRALQLLVMADMHVHICSCSN